MSPNLEGPPPETPSLELELLETTPFLGPLSISTASDQDVSSIEMDISNTEDIEVLASRLILPMEQNLRELLVRVTSTEALETVTQLKLRVISREMSLQHLSIYTPALRELILDGSMVASLRDIGCELKNLKILSVNRCGLTCFDGMFGLESLEEIYAADNRIQDVIPCTFLPHIRIIDLQRNCLQDINAVSFLSICPDLEHLYLEGNEIAESSSYRQMIRRFLPLLKTLDGEDCTREDFSLDRAPSEVTREEFNNITNKLHTNADTRTHFPQFIEGNNSHRNRLSTSDLNTRFTVQFPPKLFSGRSDGVLPTVTLRDRGSTTAADDTDEDQGSSISSD